TVPRCRRRSESGCWTGPMTSVPDLLIEHGVAVVFAWAFVVQAGVPAPAIPMLLGAGALSGSGRLHVVLAVAAALAATPSADVLWYSLGRSYGARALRSEERRVGKAARSRCVQRREERTWVE